MKTKRCYGCQEFKLLESFSRRKSNADGLQDKCKPCVNAYLKDWRDRNLERKRQMDRDYAAANRERARTKTRLWVLANPDRKKENDRAYVEANKERLQLQSAIYRAENRDEIQAKKRRHRIENREQILAKQKAWKAANKGKVLANVAFRKARKRQATPPWLTVEQRRQMRDLYETAEIFRANMNDDFHVDHIIPINHPLVCGLHVPWNLQILTAADNLRKGNNVELGPWP